MRKFIKSASIVLSILLIFQFIFLDIGYAQKSITENTETRITKKIPILADAESDTTLSTGDGISKSVNAVESSDTSDTTSPTVPQDLSYQALSQDSIELEWTTSTDDSGSVSYVVYRDDSMIATVSGSAIYIDSGLQPDKEYKYQVEAFDSSDNYSEKSEALTAMANTQNNITVSNTTESSIKVQLYNANRNNPNNTIFPWYKIYNTGNTAIDLSNLELRYYYTIDGEKTQNFWCDWSNIGAANIIGTFVKMPEKKKGADYYLQIRFKNEAGTLEPGESAELQCRIGKTDWINYDQSNDYSFNTNDTTYIDWNKVTAYINSTLVWGSEPGTETPADITAPTAPEDLISYSISSSEVTISWTASTDDTGVSGYIIYKNGVEIARVGEGTSYTDTGLSPETTYTYEVAAYDYSNNISEKSQAVSTKTGDNINSSLKLQLYNANRADPNNTIFPWYKIYNTGNVPINLEAVKMRYYYTINGEKQQNFWCDWSSASSSNVVGNFIKMPAVVEGVDYCLEISFKSGAGILQPGESAEVQCRIAKNEWIDYRQSDDYSFNANGSGYIDWNKVTGYIDGRLVWGTEPITALKNITVTPESKSIALSWDAVPCATSYEVEADGVLIDNGAATTYTQSDLIPGTKHKYRIRAKNEIMYGPWSQYLTEITLLDKPENITREVTETQINLSWDAVEGAESYDIEINGSIINNGTLTSYAMDNLEAGTIHTVRIRAKGADVDGEWTDFMQIWTLPDIPSNIHTTSLSSSITLAWDSVTGASGYDVEVYGTAVDNGSSTSYSHTGLEPNTQRTYRVRAKNDSGVSEWSDIIAAATLPGSAFNLQVQATENSLIVTWDAQAGALAYEIEIDGSDIIELNEIKYVHEGLTTNSEHTYRVRAENADGAGDWSETVKGVVLPFVPCDFVVSNVSSSAITLNWDEVTGATGYEIEIDGKVFDNGLNTTYVHSSLNPNEEHIYRVRALNGDTAGEWTNEIQQTTLLPAPINLQATAAGDSITLQWDLVVVAESYQVEINGQIYEAGSDTEYIQTEITPGSTYTFKVRAVDSNGQGDWSTEVTKAALLGIPANIKASSQSDSITITWNAVNGAFAYDVMIDGTIISNISGTSYECNGLSPNSMHIYMVRAKNSDFTGEWSSPGEWSVPESTFTIVGIPANVQTSASSTEIIVTWDEVDGADSYDIMVDEKVVSNGSKTIYKHSGLLCNSQHSYSVRARNENGPGKWSDTVTQITGPAVPTNIRAEAQINQIALSWDKSEGAVSYEVEADGEIVEDILTESFVNEGLEPNTRHEYRIRAKNKDGIYSEWSEMLEVNTIDELIIDVERDTGFNFVVAVPKKEGIDSYDIVVNYNPEDVEVLDLYAATEKLDTETGAIEGTDIYVKEFADGKIVYEVSKTDASSITIIKFMSKVTEKTSMSYTIEQ